LEGSAADAIAFAAADPAAGRISDLPTKGYRFERALRTKKGGLAAAFLAWERFPAKACPALG
jgi:hypothetical protein